jgi:hypothetical protein
MARNRSQTAHEKAPSEKSFKSWLSFQAKSLNCVLFPQHSSKKIAQLLAPEPVCCAQNGVRASFGPALRGRRTALPRVRRTNPDRSFRIP